MRKERDWLERATAEGRLLEQGRLLPVLPAGVAGNGNGHGPATGNGHARH